MKIGGKEFRRHVRIILKSKELNDAKNFIYEQRVIESSDVFLIYVWETERKIIIMLFFLFDTKFIEYFVQR